MGISGYVPEGYKVWIARDFENEEREAPYRSVIKEVSLSRFHDKKWQVIPIPLIIKESRYQLQFKINLEGIRHLLPHEPDSENIQLAFYECLATRSADRTYKGWEELSRMRAVNIAEDEISVSFTFKVDKNFRTSKDGSLLNIAIKIHSLCISYVIKDIAVYTNSKQIKSNYQLALGEYAQKLLKRAFWFSNKHFTMGNGSVPRKKPVAKRKRAAEDDDSFHSSSEKSSPLSPLVLSRTVTPQGMLFSPISQVESVSKALVEEVDDPAESVQREDEHDSKKRLRSVMDAANSQDGTKVTTPFTPQVSDSGSPVLPRSPLVEEEVNPPAEFLLEQDGGGFKSFTYIIDAADPYQGKARDAMTGAAPPTLQDVSDPVTPQVALFGPGSPFELGSPLTDEQFNLPVEIAIQEEKGGLKKRLKSMIDATNTSLAEMNAMAGNITPLSERDITGIALRLITSFIPLVEKPKEMIPADLISTAPERTYLDLSFLDLLAEEPLDFFETQPK